MGIFNTILELPSSPKNLTPSQESLVAFDLEFNSIVQTDLARTKFLVDGQGLSVAVFDTGINAEHECFTGRLVPGRNFSTEGNADDTSDSDGHGTNVAGLIGGKGTRSMDPREGIATAVNIIPVKVLPGTFAGIAEGLRWVSNNSEKEKISAVNLSLGVPQTNYISDEEVLANDDDAKMFGEILGELYEKRIAVILAAGNDYASFNEEGMAFPAIMRQCISVGAVFDSFSLKPRQYRSGAVASRTQADQITPFTQRLSREINGECFTTVFAPGASATSAGIGSNTATSVQDGTSQAAPTVTGVVLLLQQFVLRQSGKLPTIPFIKSCLRASTTLVQDSDLDADNVVNTNRLFPRLDAYDTLLAAQSALTISALD